VKLGGVFSFLARRERRSFFWFSSADKAGVVGD